MSKKESNKQKQEFSSMTIEEIALEKGITECTVRSVLNKALTKLAKNKQLRQYLTDSINYEVGNKL
jgi:predicted transcriptional regulator